MKLKRNCIFFNANTPETGGTPDWEHTLGQGKPSYLLKEVGCSDILNGLAYNLVDQAGFKYGKGGDNYDVQMVSIFENTSLIIYDAESKKETKLPVNKPLIVTLIKQNHGDHIGRRLLKFNSGFTYNSIKNSDFYDAINAIVENPWFGYKITYDNLHTGILTLTIIKAPLTFPDTSNNKIRYKTKEERKAIWDDYASEYASKFDEIDKSEKAVDSILLNDVTQKIYYGAPGTGKSYKTKHISSNIKTVTTFHPDSDYSSFVGTYKPVMDGENITYKFTPQQFITAYIKAWENIESPYYLIIEEINRGNCAQIFGDIFQLLDRSESGFSEYVVDIDKDLTAYLKEYFTTPSRESINETYINNIAAIMGNDVTLNSDFEYNKIALPKNLSILATMNTSDQSLFPMDSAFKRRWDWEYIPINASEVEDVTINIGENRYSWSEFITKVNVKIEKAHDSEDKQLGPYFVKATKKIVDGIELKYITQEQFVSKVMFYLWYEVFKDEVSNTIFITKEKKEGQDKLQDTRFTFNKLFVINPESKESEVNCNMLEKFLGDSLEMKPLPNPAKSEANVESTENAESTSEQSAPIEAEIDK